VPVPAGITSAACCAPPARLLSHGASASALLSAATCASVSPSTSRSCAGSRASVSTKPESCAARLTRAATSSMAKVSAPPDDHKATGKFEWDRHWIAGAASRSASRRSEPVQHPLRENCKSHSSGGSSVRRLACFPPQARRAADARLILSAGPSPIQSNEHSTPNKVDKL
jgi:hypothetical protein